METVLIQINNSKAYKLLEDLEDLNLIKMMKQNTLSTRTKLSDKYRGVFLKVDAESFDMHTQTTRKEWDNI